MGTVYLYVRIELVLSDYSSTVLLVQVVLVLDYKYFTKYLIEFHQKK
jgi:hypothetical protein